MPFFFRANQTLDLQIGQMVAHRDGINPNRLGQCVDGAARLAQEGL
jgi:hypothetical protein